MSKELLFVQCELFNKRNENEEERHSIAWIPEKYAIVGKQIKIKINSKWEEGFEVVDVFHSIKKTEKEANIDAEAWKHQREVSDI